MTTALIPNRFLFDFEFPLVYRRQLPKIDGDLADWPDECLLPKLGEIDGRRDFADVWCAWNEQGIAVACQVAEKRRPLQCDPASFKTGDNLRLCLDMRDARGNKRATRFCQQFYFLPSGGGPNCKSACAGTAKFERAREDAPVVRAELMEVASRVTKTAYALEAFIPAQSLTGFDPDQHPRIGFYYILEDGDHGQQYLTVGDDLNWWLDPSTWAAAVLHKSVLHKCAVQQSRDR